MNPESVPVNFPETDKGCKIVRYKLGTCRMVPDSSVFTARKPIEIIYSYNKLSISSSNIIRELLNMTT
jgi:hypothetical protein